MAAKYKTLRTCFFNNRLYWDGDIAYFPEVKDVPDHFICLEPEKVCKAKKEVLAKLAATVDESIEMPEETLLKASEVSKKDFVPTEVVAEIVAEASTEGVVLPEVVAEVKETVKTKKAPTKRIRKTAK